MIRPSWEVFDECPKCFTRAGKPCYSLKSQIWDLKEITVPHRGRKRRSLND